MQLSRMYKLRNMRRSLAVLALLAWVGVDAADAAHRLTVRHVACSDHAGELDELSSGSRHDHSDVTTTLCSDAPAEGHGHDHCRLVLNALAPLPKAPTSTIGVAQLTTVGTFSVAVAPLHVSARWRVAPKTSPPV